MKRFALAILVVTAVAATVFAILNRPGAEATPDVTITVNSTDDTDDRNDKLTLREAMMLATGGLSLGELTSSECGQVSGAVWALPSGPCGSTLPVGTLSDTIVFDTDDFPLGSPATIFLGDGLPFLSRDGDTVDGSSAGVIVDGMNRSFTCFWLGGNGNSIRGLEIYNCAYGVVISGWANTIGGTSSSERNVISGNLYGLEITSSAEDNMVQGNYIGANAAGDKALPNGSDGVFIHDDARGNTVGGVNPGEGNTIAFNTGRGVFVLGEDVVNPVTERNTIRGNSIHSNGGAGIVLKHANKGIDPPVIEGIDSVSGTACPNCIIDVYSDDEDEGRVYEGSTTADGAGNWSFSGTPEGPKVTATATDSDGNTSEFSDPLAAPEATPTSTATAAPPAGPTRILQWGAGWHNDAWSGADGTAPEDAFACADGSYAAAYRFTDAGLERYFPDRPDISNMGPVNKYDAFLTLVTAPVSCTMPIAP